jgi:hypothetical protein
MALLEETRIREAAEGGSRMNRRARVRRSLPLAFMAAGAICMGCAGGALNYVHPDADFSHIQRCAILPFENLTSDGFADQRVQSIFLMELLRHGSPMVVDPEETISVMRELKINPATTPTPEQIVALGKALSVEGVFLGTVEEYGLSNRSHDQVYYVTGVFELAETETGQRIWRSQVHVDGSSLLKQIFGGDSASQYDVTRKAVRKSLGTLF